jgi:hypothetical protein
MRSKKELGKETKPLVSGKMMLLTKSDQSRKKRYMQYTESVVDCLKGMVQEQPEPIDWQCACEQVTDPRRKQGQRFSLTAILLLALAAILSNHLSELAIAEWGAGQSEEVKKALGFEKGVTPHQSTIQRLFRSMSADELETALRGLFVQLVPGEEEQRGANAVSIDGKAQRGRLKFEEEQGYPIHAVSLRDQQSGIVLSQGHVEKADVAPAHKRREATEQTEQETQAAHEEQKQKSELAVAYRLIQPIDWNGKVLTGDALYCQRCLCAALRLAGGDYLFLVKGNQPQLLEDLRVLFAPLAPPTRAGKASCTCLSNRHKPRRKRMGVWRSVVFGSRPNSRATRIGLAWSKSLRSVGAGNTRGNGMKPCAMA